MACATKVPPKVPEISPRPRLQCCSCCRACAPVGKILVSVSWAASATSPKTTQLRHELDSFSLRRRAAKLAHMHQALQTDTILTAILLSLDRRELLTSATRVCRRWHSLIEGSPLLRRYLFFDASAESCRTINPLLQANFPPWFELPEYRQGVWAGFAHQPPAVAKIPLAQPEHREALTRSGASWRRMLVQQPPIFRLGFVLAETAYSTAELDFPDGLRMGALYDLVYSYSCRDDNPASWCMVWAPAPSDFDDTVAHWMTKKKIALTLNVIKFDAWGASVFKLKDRRRERGRIEWASLRPDEYEEVKVDVKFYFLPR